MPTPSPTAPQLPPPLSFGPAAPPHMSGPASTPPPARAPFSMHHARAFHHRASGVVSKTPSFYSFYTGPHLAELNAVKASGKLIAHRTFVFTGTNQGRINQGPAAYVWGVDRSGHSPASFEDRPGVTFDAVVVVRLDPSLAMTAQVIDLASGASTDLPASAVRIHGAKIRVKVPASVLPSTGLPPSQYRFNFWPEDGGPPISSSVASFLPESTDVQVGSSGRA